MGCVLLLGCADSVRVNSEPGYFDNEQFFETQISLLEKNPPGLLKDVQTAEETAAVKIENVNWEKELAVFRNVSLNKSSFRGKFRVDSALTGNELTISYFSSDEKMLVKSYKVNSFSGIVKWIEVRKETRNALFTNDLYLRFTVDSGYCVKGTESLNGIAKSSYTVNASFKNTYIK